MKGNPRRAGGSSKSKPTRSNATECSAASAFLFAVPQRVHLAHRRAADSLAGSRKSVHGSDLKQWRSTNLCRSEGQVNRREAAVLELELNSLDPDMGCNTKSEQGDGAGNDGFRISQLKRHHADLAKHLVGSIVLDERHVTDNQLPARAGESHVTVA